MKSPIYLSAGEASTELGVRQATLYAYVSRGLIRSIPGPGRQRRYHAEDVRALRDRRDAGEPSSDKSGATGPLLETQLTLITEQGPVYRGQPAVKLARTSSLEAVATLLWDCTDDPFANPAPQAPEMTIPDLRPLERVMMAFAAWPAIDRAAFTLSHRLLIEKGAALLRAGIGALIGEAPSSDPVHLTLARGWNVVDPKAIDLIRAALVLSADHEFNTSAFAVRCAASTRAPLHAALIAGLGAFSGPRHGAASERVGAWLEKIGSADDIEPVMQELLIRGEELAGFGNVIYETRDPRAACLLELIAEGNFDHPLAGLLPQIIATADALFGKAPNIDFAFAAIQRLLKLPAHAGMSIFCAGRLTGWIAHALEQYQRADRIRPRAIYTGERPRS
ncbi:helix-turn-helix domain-containing protein [Stappia sp. F7233]|uniref:citrate synthase (unknown stereospecificity) n=1 Tax=Stappia albiluteola TaxID=2758565 RepID=A0A839AFR8_9HYPH|nr:citrate synthase family protein [Stappia albiluteola]MBA5777399.1 helix-turn-helix domain-containing protein [Stappia albiluteola]